ncbi:MAG: 5'/3'-nucleotidase SurE [Phycisphaerales bacterium]|nr:5'/3'-nucleotidase SurE [Phycisphaerales bacterium]
MRILLTNDDGIRAPGIVALYDALTDAHLGFGGALRDPRTGAPAEVFVVAPETVQSATSHGVTFHEPLMTREVTVNDRMKGVAVEGRPADCVKLALSAIWPEIHGPGSAPDLVISGMNAGANCGVNVIYSGTVAAAIEAAFLGVPSIAVSLHLGGGTPLFDAAAGHARRAVERILASGPIERHECLNINIPRTESPRPRAPGDDLGTRQKPAGWDVGRPPSEGYDPRAPLPVRVCTMNTHGLVDRYERRVSPSGDVYYWSAGDGMAFHGTEPGSDVDLLFSRHITVTPLTYDLTRRGAMQRWVGRLNER